jgi:hypothetical protein
VLRRAPSRILRALLLWRWVKSVGHRVILQDWTQVAAIDCTPMHTLGAGAPLQRNPAIQAADGKLHLCLTLRCVVGYQVEVGGTRHP